MMLSDDNNNKLTVNNKADQKESSFKETIQQTERIADDQSDSVETVIKLEGDNTPISLLKQSSDNETDKSLDDKYGQTGLELEPVKHMPFEVFQERKKETKDNHSKRNYKNKNKQGNSTPSQYSHAIPQGNLLEYRIKRLVFKLGYYPRIGIDLKTSYDEAADKITDLDVYGIYVHKDFTAKTLWVDCKSGGVRIHDRLSWIKGVMSTIQTNDVILVAGGVRTSVKQHARKSGIQILDLNIIEKLEKDYGIKSDDWRGSWNPNTQFSKIITLSRISIPTNDQYKKIAKFISSDFWVMDSYPKAKKALTALRELSTAVSITLPEEQSNAIKWAIYELIVMFLLAVLTISKELYYFSDSEKKETIYEGLASGDVPNKKRAEIIDAAVRFAYNTFKSQVPDFKEPLKIPIINLNPPSYADSFFDLILRITNKPSYFFDILRFLDFVLMEYDLNNKPYNEDDLRSIFDNFENVLVGSKTLLHFICHTTNISRTIFSILK
jgi:hypothetical protein